MRKTFKKSLVIGLLLLMTVMSGPADASPLRTTTARAFGAKIDLLNTNVLAETPPNIVAGPEPGTGSNNLVTVPLGTVVSNGTASAKAQVTRDSVIQSELPGNLLRVFRPGGAPRPELYNARAFSRVDGLAILASDVDGLPPEVGLILTTAGVDTLVAADAIASEALVSCVDGRPVLVGGTLLAGARVLGSDLTDTLDGSLNQTVVPAGNTVLELLGGRIIANEVVKDSDGELAINALHVILPGVLDVVLAHSEVTGVACGPPPQCSDGIDNDGDRKIDAEDPGCHTDGDANNPNSYDPNDDSESNLLPRTGGGSPLLGASLLALGGLMLLATRKLRRSTI